MATPKKSNIDITKVGPQSYRDLQKANREAFEQASHISPFASIKSSNDYVSPTNFIYEGPEMSPLQQLGSTPWGQSMFDERSSNEAEYQILGDIRAENQPWYLQLGAGIAKGVSLAGTTFLDGTIGLLTGAVKGAVAKIRGESWLDSLSKLWNNEVSNGLAEINKGLEETLPNYRTSEELENPWYKNLGTMNFWADSVIKNLGFTVGAFYSGNVLKNALGALNIVKGAMGAKVTGSLLSAVNEGRIEANHGASDFLNLQLAQIIDQNAELTGNQEQVEYMRRSGLSEEEIIDQFAMNNKRIAELKQDAVDRANVMGLITLIGNTVLLSLDDYAQFGKLYARGFKNARGLSSGISKAAKEIAAEEAGKNIIKQGSKYAWKDITKKQALMKGLKNGLLEGNEEMAQAFIAETAGNMQSPDSPDAYYEALTDRNAQLKTKDFLTSVTEGFANTYGNGDEWEQFAVGAFTGLLGMPTFGKVNNSDANTYLGRGRSIGLSGGLFGEIRNANQQNREGREAVDVMNKYVDKTQNHARYFAQSQSFTDAMDGWAEADDAFEYKNAEDNDDFAAISRFAQTGKLNDLKEMVSQSFENLSDDELVSIATITSPNVKMGEDGTVETSNDNGSPAVGGWRNTDGSLMSDTEEGRARMRKELIDKRDKILSEINKYEKSVETVRAIGNNSLTEDQVNELAWLNWKVGMFTDRYNSIKAENEKVLTDIQNSIQAFQRGRDRGMIDEESDEGKRLIKAIENAGEFISVLRSAKTPLQLGALVEANPHLTDFLEDWAYPIIENITGIDAATFEKAMTDLRDTTRIAKATRTFNQRYKEFKEDPIKLIKNRERIDKKKDKVNKASEDVNLKDKVDNADVSEIVHGMESGDLDEGQLDGLFSDEGNEFLNNVGTEGQPQPSGRQKVEEAKKIIKTSQRMEETINSLDDGSISTQALADARTLLQHSKEVANSTEELLDTNTQAFNDPNNLVAEFDEAIQEANQEELETILGERIDLAKSVIERAKAKLEEADEELKDLPEGNLSVRVATPEEVQGKETGHDTTGHIPTENERQKAEAAQRAAQALSAEEQAKVNDLFQDLKEGMSQENVRAFDKAVSEVLKSIDMLIGAKATSQEIGKLVNNTQSYQIAKQLAPELDDYLNVYVTSRLNPKAAESTKQEEEPKIATPVITDQEVRQQTTAHYNSDSNQSEDYVTYNYWKPTITQAGLHNPKGDNTPYYVVARYITSAFGKDPSDFTQEEKAYWKAYVEPGFVRKPYTLQQLKRMEAVYKYMTDRGAFNLVNSGVVQGEVGKKAFNKSAEGDKIGFAIDASLNSDAGETVILITDSQGRILGDVMSTNDPTFERQIGLKSFVERVTREYQEAGSPQYFVSKETSIVDKNMVGRPPYLADHEVMHTLNEVFVDGEQQMPFKIAVAVTSGKNARILASAGRTKGQGQSKLEQVISSPLSAKAGQPFLLLPTSDKSGRFQYVTVPFMMDSYSPATQGTALGKAIHKVLERIPTADNAHAMGIINDLEELLSVQEIHINYNGDNVKVTIKPNGAEHQMTIYNGAKNAPNIVEQLELGLQGQPFQVSRKYMNEDYDGQDYNRMIGEVAKVNLPIGTTHTVSDWFTIKPINAAGQKMKTKSPRSTGSNPHAATPQYITITKKGMALNVNPATWEVTDSTGKVYTSPNTNKVKAQAFGMYMNKNMEQPYDTEWGYYDPKTDEFVEKPNRVLRTLGEPQQGTTEDAGKLYDRVSKTHPWLIDLMNVTKEFLENSNKRRETKESLMNRFKSRATDEGRDIISDNDLATLIDYIFGPIIENPATQSIQESKTPAQPQQGTVVKSVTITNPHTKKSYTIRVGETRRIDDGMYPGVSTIKDIQDDGIIVDSYYDETSETTTTRFLTQDQYLIELSYATLATNPSTATESSTELKDKAKKAGLLGNKVREALWARLTPEQQSTIANKKGPKQKQWMDALETAFDPATNTFDEAKLKGTVDEFLGRKGMYRKTDGSQGVFNKQRELSWMQKALPQLSTKEHLEFIDRLIEVAGSKDGEVAWGKFQNGLITISDLAARGTLYHEAFHAVAHMLLNEREYQKLFDAAVKRWGDIDRVQLEENLAEDFRRYMQSEEDWYDNLQEKGYGPLRKSIATIFHKLKNRCKALFGKNVYMNRLYSNISRGKYADRKVKSATDNVGTYSADNPDIRYRYNDRVDSLEHEIAQIDRDIQSIRSQRKAATQNKIAQKWETINGEKYAKISNTGYLSEYSALQDIPNEYRDIITSFESYGRHYLYLKSKEESARDIEELRQEQDRLKQRLERLKENKWDLISNEALQDQEAHYRVIDQYHRDKYMYGNLSQEDRDYLQERGITPQEFSQMTQLEKEVLFHCKY